MACAEVELDVLSGDHSVLRADMLVDVGNTINAHLDVGQVRRALRAGARCEGRAAGGRRRSPAALGRARATRGAHARGPTAARRTLTPLNPPFPAPQIEGAFAQGVGLCTIEEVTWADSDHPWAGPRGRLFTRGPGGYKLPSFNDVPHDLRVGLLPGAPNKFAVHSSKVRATTTRARRRGAGAARGHAQAHSSARARAHRWRPAPARRARPRARPRRAQAVGEPPLFLGFSVFLALKDAVRAARAEHAGTDPATDCFELRSPATSERLRLACLDRFARESIRLNGHEEKGYQPKGSF